MPRVWHVDFQKDPAKSNYQRTTINGQPTISGSILQMVGCPLIVVR